MRITQKELLGVALFGWLFGWLLAEERPDALLQAWMEFLKLQSNQSEEFNRDFPVDDRLYGNLNKCGKYLEQSTSAESLSPASIQIYAEVGHLLVFCAGQTATTYLANHNSSPLNLSHIAHSFKSGCLESLHTKSKKPSLPKMLNLMGSQLEVFESNIKHSNLQAWTRHIVRMIGHANKHNSYHKWKLILLAPSLFDIKPGESTHKLAQDTMQSLQIIQHKLPSKTVVLLIRNTKQAFWRAIAEKVVFCQKMMSLWRLHEQRKADLTWNVLESRIKENYRRDNFYVHIVDVIDESRPVFFHNKPDVSILSPDCMHLSSRGLSLLHSHLWNWLVQPSKQIAWTPLVRPLYCPRPKCPFLVTAKNIRSCYIVRKPVYEEGTTNNSNFLLFGLLTISVIIYVLLFLYIACS